MKTIDPKVYLTQTDTIVGFVSQNRARLDEIKDRSPGKSYIKALPSLKALKSHTRVPSAHFNIVRRSSRATFIFRNGSSYRVIRDKHHRKLIKTLGWAYSTSANRSSRAYDEEWAKTMADVTIEPLQNSASAVSAIFRLGKKVLKKIR
jgi:tRNA A37 threonylcarbamoyladenosine synthetase subunit TsaC/SUA5/YrdC